MLSYQSYCCRNLMLKETRPKRGGVFYITNSVEVNEEYVPHPVYIYNFNLYFIIIFLSPHHLTSSMDFRHCTV